MRLACHSRPTETALPHTPPPRTVGFSRRLPADLTPSATALQLQRAQALCNLMQSNPRACGFDIPRIPWELADARVHAPDPMGLLPARRAVATYIGERYGPADVRRLMLTASTSEAYALLFKLLTDPGDSIVTGTPGYPLVQHLAELEHLTVRTFANGPSGCGPEARAAAEAHLQAGARLIVLITPDNPTGACLGPEEAAAWAALAERHGAALVVDHVFAPYGDVAWPCVMAAFARAPVVFFLDGVSKAAGMPHVKLGWIDVRGASAAAVRDAVARLAWLGDAYLSVSHVVQAMAPALLDAARAVQPQIRQRIASNRAWLADALAPVPEVSLQPSDGGWYGVLRLPQSIDEDDVVVALAQDAQVQLHPGYFYDFAQRGHLVTGLLAHPDVFVPGWRRAIEVLKGLYQ